MSSVIAAAAGPLLPQECFSNGVVKCRILREQLYLGLEEN
jgi:hypothetical protein